MIGSPSVLVDGRPVTFRYAKSRALLFRLVLDGQRLGRGTAAAFFWPDLSEEAARTNLRGIVSDLRATVGPYVDLGRHEIGVQDDADVRSDVDDMLAAIAHTAGRGHAADTVPPYAELLDGVSVRGAPSFEAWIYEARERFRNAVRSGALDAADHAEADGRPDDATTFLRRALDAVPWDESVHRRLIERLVRSGRRDQALHQYAACTDALREHLGVRPDPATHALVRTLLNPPTAQRRFASPNDVAPMVGREHEMHRVIAAFASGTTSLVSIVGAPGIGTSRLASEVTARLGSSGDTVRVALHGVREADTFALAVASALGIDAEAHTRDTSAMRDALLSAIQTEIGSQSLVLLLDDVDGDMDLAPTVSDLLRTCPGLRIVTAGRLRVGTTQEHTLRLGPLALPSPDTSDASALASSPSGALLLHAAQRVDLGYGPASNDEVRALVRLLNVLGGHPLAVLLAGARVPILGAGAFDVPTERLAEHLSGGPRDLPERHRSVVAACHMELSRLSDPERRIVDGLAVFAAPAATDAIAFVTDTPASLTQTLITRLAERAVGSVGRSDDGEKRFSLDPALRLAALHGRAIDAPSWPAADRHATWFERRVAAFASAARGHDQIDAVRAYAAETDDVERALDRLAHARPIAALRVATSAWQLEAMAGRARGALARLRPLVDRWGSKLEPIEQSDALNAAGALALRCERRAEARAFFARALNLRERAGDRARVAASHLNLATLDALRGEHPEAEARLGRAMHEAEKAGDTWLMAAALTNLAHVLDLRGKHDSAIEAYERGALHLAELGDAAAEAGAWIGMLEAAARAGNRSRVASAAQHVAHALRHRTTPDADGLAVPLQNATEAARAIGAHDAEKILQEQIERLSATP